MPREGINVILAGSIGPRRSGYEVSVDAVDPANGEVLGTASASAASKADVLKAVGSIASDVRALLGDTTPESEKLAAAETVSAASLDAVRDYARAQDLLYDGKKEEAIVYYRRAIDNDRNFGRAYAGWAICAYDLGRREEAAELYKTALSLTDRMTEREKFRTFGTYYMYIARNQVKAVETYSDLVKAYPADRAGHANLALAHFYARDFPKALDAGRKAVELGQRKNMLHRNNYALYAMYAAD